MRVGELSDGLERASLPVREVRALQPLIDRISRAKVVMLGESTHGTEEFYRWRRLITQWLITKHGFRLLALEWDWPEAVKIHRYARFGEGRDARTALERTERWPTWMWANTEMIRLVEWLRSHEGARGSGEPVRVAGLDLYALFESMEAVIRCLEEISPLMARRAKKHYACLDRFSGDEMLYARSTLKFPRGCEEEVSRTLEDLLRLRIERAGREGLAAERLIDAQQSARVVRSAESYYRTLIHGDDRSWNIRDRHMLETLRWLLEVEEGKAIVWAHNTHIGDYRATEMAREGLVNLGGLAREHWGEEQVALVGFGTFEGRVMASRAWEGPMQEMTLPPAKPASLDAAYHALASKLECPQVVSIFDEKSHPALRDSLDQRAIGVVFDPEHERGNYTATALARRYDAFFHIDRTSALEPLVLPFEREKFPETWPMGR